MASCAVLGEELLEDGTNTFSFLLDTFNDGHTTYMGSSITIDALAMGDIILGFSVLNEQDTGVEAGLLVDCVQFSGGNFDCGASIPEPGTLALLGLGLAGLSFAGRRKKSRLGV